MPKKKIDPKELNDFIKKKGPGIIHFEEIAIFGKTMKDCLRALDAPEPIPVNNPQDN